MFLLEFLAELCSSSSRFVTHSMKISIFEGRRSCLTCIYTSLGVNIMFAISKGIFKTIPVLFFFEMLGRINSGCSFQRVLLLILVLVEIVPVTTNLTLTFCFHCSLSANFRYYLSILM